MVMAFVACACFGVFAQTPVYTPDPTVYSNTITSTGTYLNALIAAYGVPAILVALAIRGLSFVWGLTKRAFH
jgi:hypothetical protein